MFVSFTKCFLLFLLFGFCTQNLQAKPFALGAIFGRPTGLSGKYWLNRKYVVAGALGWSESHIYGHGDYLRRRPKTFKLDGVPFGTFYGIGLKVREVLHDKDLEMRMGLRAPVGVRYRVKDPRLELFTEIAVGMDLLPSTQMTVDFAIGVRYIFL